MAEKFIPGGGGKSATPDKIMPLEGKKKKGNSSYASGFTGSDAVRRRIEKKRFNTRKGGFSQPGYKSGEIS